MLIDLRDIIDVPGKSVSFDFTPNLSDAASGSILRINNSPRAVGFVKNSAGVLSFSADVSANLTCVCARCLAEFDQLISKHISVFLTEGGDNGDDPLSYTITADSINADDIISTEFVLDTDQRFLCRDDCSGICQSCGADLNLGPCSCIPQTDPRLAALAQFLDNKEVF